MFIGSIFSALLLISTVSAVPNTQSNSVMELINDLEDNKTIIEYEALINIIYNVQSGGIIDLLIQLITLIIQFILEIIDIIQNIMGLVNLVQSLIDAFTTLFQLIQDLIELIGNIFNPSLILN